jgi:hypothetical protein
LYHAKFSTAYLKSVHDKGAPQNEEEKVTLRSTPPYDFCKPEARAKWLQIFVALIEYLRSGESKVGFLNKSLQPNYLHKEVEEQYSEQEQSIEHSTETASQKSDFESSEEEEDDDVEDETEQEDDDVENWEWQEDDAEDWEEEEIFTNAPKRKDRDSGNVCVYFQLTTDYSPSESGRSYLLKKPRV